MRIPEHKYAIYLLACVCGLVDVTCFVGLDGVFSAMMTGNILMFTIALADGHPIEMGLKYLRALDGFTIGVIIAARVMKVCGGGNPLAQSFLDCLVATGHCNGLNYLAGAGNTSAPQRYAG
ncbi:DUF1275 family protein [Polynucleobacter necessarius]|uniref:DUF1275 family protein n=1 Tax=Polynucleobacter necessarius TaxID=576610 RepID=UPI000E09ADD2|nr:DUF1275 family protein [Polynucleobacter necessarius]